MKISEIANKLNQLSENYQIGGLQTIRKKLKGFTKVSTYNLFDTKTSHDKDGWAYHVGGRGEFQFNLGLEEETEYFRFGLAFSLKKNRSLLEPVLKLSPKIDKANQYIKEHSNALKNYQMWYYQNGERSLDMPIQSISENLKKEGTFIFIGGKIQKSFDDISVKDLKFVLETFDDLLPFYEYVESEVIEIESKIARLCWNEFNWQKPSGKESKSKNIDSHEYQKGYGHEEWLLDMDKIIDGYHYGFIQCFNSRSDFSGMKYNLSLFTINGKTKERYWIGEINEIEVISEKESKRVYDFYKKVGWHDEMIEQLKIVDVDSTPFKNTPPEIFSNVKFKLNNLRLLEKPLRFSNTDSAVPSTYYSTLLNKKVDPKLESSIDGEFVFISGHRVSKESTKIEYGKRKGEIDLFHNKMQTKIYNQFVDLYGKDCVGTELDSGSGTKIDLVVKQDEMYDYYELKTSNSIKGCIREALPQLLEYAYWKKRSFVKKLVIVSQNPITEEAKVYLDILRSDFKINIYYQWYDPEIQLLIKDLY